MTGEAEARQASAITRIFVNDFSSSTLLSIKRGPQALPNTGIPLSPMKK